MFKNLLRNFRFWILIGGIIFYIAGLVMRGFGTPVCEGDTLYGVGEIFLMGGSLLIWVGIILCLVQITARFIEKRFLKKKTVIFLPRVSQLLKKRVYKIILIVFLIVLIVFLIVLSALLINNFLNQQPIKTSIEVENLANKSCYTLCRENLSQTCMGNIGYSEKTPNCICTCETSKNINYKKLDGKKVIFSNKNDWVEVLIHEGRYGGNWIYTPVDSIHDRARDGEKVVFVCYVNSSKTDLAYAFHDRNYCSSEIFAPDISEDILKSRVFDKLISLLNNKSLNIQVSSETLQMVENFKKDSQIQIQQTPITINMATTYHSDFDAYAIYLLNEDNIIIGRDYIPGMICD